MSSDIYVMDADGGNPTRLTNNGVWVGFAWSPDGEQIAFVSDREIYVVDANGGNLTRLTNTGVERLQIPAWSPDGQQIVFMADVDIYVMDANGGNLTQLTNTTERTLKVFFSPTWSPDGDKITFFARREDNYDNFNSDIYVIDTDGGNLTRVTNTKGRVYSLAWSPDGEQIAFISEEGAGSSDIDVYAVEIYVMDADGGNPTRLTNNGVWVSGGLAWSPDGDQIAFLSFVSKEGAGGPDTPLEIYVMDADGGNLTRLTFNGFWLGFAWSP